MTIGTHSPMQPLQLLFQGTGLYNKLLPLLLGKKQARTELFFLTTCKLNNMKKQHYKKRKWKWSHSVPSNSLRPHGLQPTRLLCPGDFQGKGTGVCFHFLLQGIFPTQGSNPGFPHCRQMLYHLSHQGSHKKRRRDHKVRKGENIYIWKTAS